MTLSIGFNYDPGISTALFAISQRFLAFFFYYFRVYWDCHVVEWGCVILGLAWSLITVLALSIEITDICWLISLIVDLSCRLNLLIILFPKNKELHLFNLPDIKLNNRSEYQEWKTRMPLFITAYYDAGSLVNGWQWFYLLLWSKLTYETKKIDCCKKTRKPMMKKCQFNSQNRCTSYPVFNFHNDLKQ